jgi:apolipoprotein N-acyltransferase
MSSATQRSTRRSQLLEPWRRPWPWLSLVLLALCSRSEPPRLWFWVSLLLISLLVGLLQSLARRP